MEWDGMRCDCRQLLLSCPCSRPASIWKFDSRKRLSCFAESETLEAIAQFDFTARSQRELSFKKGHVLTLYTQVSSDWWKGTKDGRDGLIPDKYILLRIRFVLGSSSFSIFFPFHFHWVNPGIQSVVMARRSIPVASGLLAYYPRCLCRCYTYGIDDVIVAAWLIRIICLGFLRILKDSDSDSDLWTFYDVGNK